MKGDGPAGMGRRRERFLCSGRLSAVPSRRLHVDGGEEGFRLDEVRHWMLGGGLVVTIWASLFRRGDGRRCHRRREIDPHPTLCESIKMARGLQGVRTDRLSGREGERRAPQRCEKRIGGNNGRTTAPRRTGISSRSNLRKNFCYSNQEPSEPARPCPRLFPRRRLRVSRNPGRPERSGHADIAR